MSILEEKRAPSLFLDRASSIYIPLSRIKRTWLVSALIPYSIPSRKLNKCHTTT